MLMRYEYIDNEASLPAYAFRVKNEVGGKLDEYWRMWSIYIAQLWKNDNNNEWQ